MGTLLVVSKIPMCARRDNKECCSTTPSLHCPGIRAQYTEERRAEDLLAKLALKPHKIFHWKSNMNCNIICLLITIICFEQM